MNTSVLPLNNNKGDLFLDQNNLEVKNVNSKKQQDKQVVKISPTTSISAYGRTANSQSGYIQNSQDDLKQQPSMIIIDKSINKESYCKTDPSLLKPPELTLIDIKNPRIQAIYNGEMHELTKAVIELKKILEARPFTFELLICFWVALHLNKFEYAQYLHSQDVLLERIISNMRKLGQTHLIEEKERKLIELQKSKKKSKDEKGLPKKKSSFSKFFNNNKEDDGQTKAESKLETYNDGGYQVTSPNLLSPPQGRSIRFEKKSSLVSKFSINDGQSLFDEGSSDIYSAGKRRNDLNYEMRYGFTDEKDLQEIRFLMKTDAAKTFNTNVLRIALNMQEEKIASIIVALYQCKIDEEMVLRSIKTNQMLFIQNMFEYNKNYEEIMTLKKFQRMKEYLSDALPGETLNLNDDDQARFKVFTFEFIIKKVIDFTEINPDKRVRDIANWRIQSTENILKALLKNNRDEIACEVCLYYIDYCDKDLFNFALLNFNETFLKILILGSKIINNLDEDRLSKVMLDQDFKDRTLIKIITLNGFKRLFTSYKVDILLEEIWVGKKTFECDGNLEDLSMLTYLLWVPIKKLKGKKPKFRELIDFNYHTTIKENKFWYQYKYRTSSISYIFQKEFLSAIGMVVLFQYINFKYLELFSQKQFVGFPPISKRALAESLIKEYNEFNYYGTVFSATLFIHQLQKLLFDLVAPQKLYLDKWTIIDFISSILNIACFNYIGNATIEQVLDENRKMFLDYYVICVTLVSWMRFFSYFLVIRVISKLMHTLIRMIYDMIGFGIIFSCYLILVASIFTTLFYEPEPEHFGSITISIRVLFDAFLGSYQYTTNPAYEKSFSVLMMTHVFVSNVFLLNFLVAILSTVYEVMIDLGEFHYKSNRYQYIEKYSIPMLDTSYFRELVIHPPPLNIFALFLIPFSFRKKTMKKTGKIFSKLMYWVENVPYLGSFLLYECVLAPIIFIKILINIMLQSTGKTIVPWTSFWLVFGIPIIVILGVGLDTFTYLRVLCSYHEEHTERVKEEEDYKHDKIIIYNEIIDVMRTILYLYKKGLKDKRNRNRDHTQEFLEAYYKQEDEGDQGYTIDKLLIIEAWARYRPKQAQILDEKINDEKMKLKAQPRDLDKIFGEKFIQRIMQGVKQKFYQGKEFDLNIEELRKMYKIQRQQRGHNNDLDYVKDNLKDDFDSMSIRDIPREEMTLIETFLDKFIFIQIGSSSKTEIDIKLALKSLPIKINMDNLQRIELLNFHTLQRSLIAFQNDDQDELFNHYDNRNKHRLRKLKNKANETDFQSQGIKDIANELLYLINRIVQKGMSSNPNHDPKNHFIQGGIRRHDRR
eukprot:403342842